MSSLAKPESEQAVTTLIIFYRIQGAVFLTLTICLTYATTRRFPWGNSEAILGYAT